MLASPAILDMAKSELSLEDLEDMLPTAPRLVLASPISLVYMLIAPPKWGKTTWFCAFPDTLLVAFERGFQFQKTPTVFIDAWDQKGFVPYTDDDGVVHMTMKLLEKLLMASDKYKFVFFDTADMGAKKCSDYYLAKHGWQHAQDGGDYGKGYDIVQNTPFRQLIGSIMGTGRGIGFITHSEVKTTEFSKGKKSKRETSLPGGIHKFLHTQADIILHGSFGIRQKGNKYRDRILQTEGDEETLAGNRSRDLYLPAKFIVDPEHPWTQWSAFFSDPSLAPEAEAELVASMGRRQREADEEPDETAPRVKRKKISA